MLTLRTPWNQTLAWLTACFLMVNPVLGAETVRGSAAEEGRSAASSESSSAEAKAKARARARAKAEAEAEAEELKNAKELRNSSKHKKTAAKSESVETDKPRKKDKTYPVGDAGLTGRVGKDAAAASLAASKDKSKKDVKPDLRSNRNASKTPTDIERSPVASEPSNDMPTGGVSSYKIPGAKDPAAQSSANLLSPAARAEGLVSALNLTYLLNQAAQAHPSIQAARLDVKASSEDLEAAQRQRWPTLSAIVENKSNNTSVISTQSLRMEQNLWDAGRVSARIREAEANIGANEARIYIQNQTLSIQIVNAWQNLLSADGRIQVARDTLSQLDKYRQQMGRRVTADVSPLIDLELVQSRILQTQVELEQALNSRQIALGKLEQYSGVEGLSQVQERPKPLPGLTQSAQAATQLLKMDLLDVASQHPEVQKARQDSQVAKQRIDAKRAEMWPQLYLRVDQPLASTNNDITGFLGFRYSPGAGLSTGVEAQALASRAASLQQSVDAAMRNVLEVLYTDRDELATGRTRMVALDKSVQGSRAVLDSYGRQFTAGRKTWQDLMNAVRELAQNQYNLADTHASMMAALYRLQIRTGQSPQPVE